MLPRPNQAFRELFMLSEDERGKLKPNEYAIYLAKEQWPHDGQWREVGHGPYIQGYLDAAQLVWDSMDEFDRANTLLFPALFLARQAVELALKEAIAKTKPTSSSSPVASPADQAGRDWLWGTHDLKRLANQFSRLYASALGPWWQPHHEFLLRLEEADPGGSFFRYCRDSNGGIFDMEGCLTGARVRTEMREAAQIIQGVADL